MVAAANPNEFTKLAGETRIHVLLVEDDPGDLGDYRKRLESRGFRVSSAEHADRALDILRSGEAANIDVLVADYAMSEMDGVELGRWAKDNLGIPTIVLTAHGSFDVVLDALRSGMFDFMAKSSNGELLAHAVRRAARFRRMESTLRHLRMEAPPEAHDTGLIGDSPAIRRTLDTISRVAGAEVSVLITGETGTGKELVARALHNQSQRKDGPFVAINCAAIPENLLESELFGHMAGAFTDAQENKHGLFVEADGGTLFLDEIAEMPLTMQSKLLRALQEQKVRPVGSQEEHTFDARVIAATNRDLEAQVEEELFREDLFYRLNVVHIALPPLRARGTDVLVLANHFLAGQARRMNRSVEGLSDSAARTLLQYGWPGNVRELESAMQHAVAMTLTNLVVAEDLPEKIRERPPVETTDEVPPESLPSMDEVERRHILRVLGAAGGNKTRAARILGLDRRTLYRKLERYGVEPGGPSPQPR